MKTASLALAVGGLVSTLSVAACSSDSGTSAGSPTPQGDDTSYDTDSGTSGEDAAHGDAGTGHDAGVTSHGDSGASTPESGTPPPAAAIDYAPYFPTWVWGGSGYAFSGLVDLQTKARLNEVTIAFVLSNGGCNTTQDIEQNMGDVTAFLAAGGHLKASFGGADGDYVESKCSSASALATAIEDFVDSTGITDLDFDIEQDPVLTDTVNEMRGQALKIVQDAKGIRVAFTLAANPSPGGGLTSQGESVVSHALSAGVTVSHVNFMTMDYGDSYGGSPLAPVVEGSLTDGHTQIMSLVSGIGSADAWAMVGVIPMIGKNDDSEVFSLADATSLAQFAKTNQIGLVSFWSIDRDQPGTDYNNASTVESSNFAFDQILQGVTQ
jgi:chitinase